VQTECLGALGRQGRGVDTGGKRCQVLGHVHAAEGFASALHYCLP